MKLHVKLIIAFVFVTFVSVALIGWISFTASENFLKEEITTKTALSTKSTAKNIELLLAPNEKLVIFLTDVPPIQGIIRAEANEGYDPEGDSTLEDWKKRLGSIFISTSEANPEIFQLRFIDEQGMELVKIVSEKERIYATPEIELQNKANMPYFQTAMELEKNQVYISPLELNREHGEIEVPYIPVVRYATPVFDEKTGQKKGIIIININMEFVAHEYLLPEEKTEIVLINKDGYYIHNLDLKKEYGFDLGHEADLFSDHPHFNKEDVANKDQGIFHDKGTMFMVWRKVSYNSLNPDEFWVLFYNIREEDLLAPVQKLKEQLFYIGLLSLSIAVILAAIISFSITKPIKELHKGMEIIGGGNLDYKIDIKTKDEIGQLGDAFNAMNKKIREHKKELETEVKRKTRELRERVGELERFHKITVGRELKMIELKKKIEELKKKRKS